MDVEKVLSAIQLELSIRNAPVALAGAFALHAHGITRATADLDLIVPREVQGELIGSLERMGYETLYRSEGYSNHLHADADLGRIDLIYVEGQTQQVLFSGCQKKPFGRSGEVLVPSVEHLIAMKVHAIKNDPGRRLRDLADIQSLLKLSGIQMERVHLLFTKAGLEKDWNELQGRH